MKTKAGGEVKLSKVDGDNLSRTMDGDSLSKTIMDGDNLHRTMDGDSLSKTITDGDSLSKTITDGDSPKDKEGGAIRLSKTTGERKIWALSITTQPGATT